VEPGGEGCGLAPYTPYAMRHFFISQAIAAGIPSYEIAKMAGTSGTQIEAAYVHAFPDAIERGRVALEAWDRRSEAAASALASPQTPALDS
jgi:hypothetical protein